MTELGAILERLGLDQYLDALVGEGFDTWETVLDIQEGDLDALNVKLGHRRKLQREIANYRGFPYERLVGSPAYESSSEAGKGGESSQSASQQGDKGTAAAAGETKRKYRRHPKPDENAPERPPSAYVIFSNKIREEIKGENLSFTVIAKLVGERWQKLAPAEREPYEEQAAAAKERYNIQLSAYKKTDAYKDYAQYLSEFKAQHALLPEGKRPKLEKEPSAGSLSAKSGELVESSTGHRRIGSIGSIHSTSYPFPSPGTLASTFNPATSQVRGVRRSGVAGTPPQTESPPLQVFGGPAMLQSAFSTQSSTSEDSWVSRGEQVEAIQRTAQLSLVTAPTAYQALSSLPPFETSEEQVRRSARRTYLPGHRDALPPINSDPATYQQYRGATASGSIASSDDRWRSMLTDTASRQSPDIPRGLQPALAIGQTVSFGTAQLPPLLNPERRSDTMHDHPQRSLPPPHIPPPRDQERGLPSLSQAAGVYGPSIAAAPLPEPSVSSSARADAPRLDRSESEAINTLAGLAATGTRPGGPKRQDRKRNQP